MTLPTLPEPDFIDRDPAATTAAMVASWEAATGKTLQPAQPERLLINQYAYRETLVRSGIQEAAKQNLLYYALSPVLGYLGQAVGVEQIPAQPATTTVRLTFPTSATTDTAIPLGTRVSNSGGDLIFDTAAPANLPVGQATVDVPVVCETAGVGGNGWAAGDNGALLDDLGVAGIVVTNLTPSAGGAEAESDDNLRERIAEAPESFTTAGSVGAYRFHARSAHPSIVDVYPRAHYPDPGDVSLYVLTDTGPAPSAVLDAVLAICSDEKVRPICDTVYAVPAEQVDYALNIQLTLYVGADEPTVLAAWRAAVDAYEQARSASLGGDIVVWQIETLARVAGVYKVSVASPAADIVLQKWQWAHCTSAAVSVAGYSGG